MRLAIDGGAPAFHESWPAWPPPVDDEQRRLVHSVLEGGAWGANVGGLCREFAQRFAAAHGTAHGVTLANGTLALSVALRAAGIGQGDEVVVPAYTFVACATSVLLVGATPVLADVDPVHLHLSGATVRAAVGPRTRAVMVVHLAGSPAPMTEILNVAREHDLVVIEDSAQAHGATYRERHVGGIGDLGTFSFQSSKAMTAGEGGLVTTDDERLADRVWSLCNVGRQRGGAWYHHADIGWNLRMTELQAAILLPWIDRLPDEIAQREQFFATLAAGIPKENATVVADPEGTTRSSRHLAVIAVGSSAHRPDREWIARALGAEGITVDLGYPSLAEIDAVRSQSRICPTPGLDAVAGSLLWVRQSMMMAGTDAADRLALTLGRVLRDGRAWGDQ